MTNGQLIERLEEFRSLIEKYFELWDTSLSSLGDYYQMSQPVKNQQEITQSEKVLSEKFGFLKKYLEVLLPTQLSVSVWNKAIGHPIALAKDQSIKSFIQGIDIILGQLKELPPDEEFGKETSATIETSLPAISKYDQIMAVLQRFNPCFSYLKSKGKYQIKSEDDVKDLLYVMLRSCFDNVEWEDGIPKAAGKGHRIDLVVKDCSTLIETKFIRDKNHANNITAELNDDLIGYTTSNYEGFIVFIYDPQKFIVDPQKIYSFYKKLITQYKFIQPYVAN